MPIKVLLVEDHEDTRFMIKTSLERLHGHRVVEASDGLLGVQVSRHELPHVIVMDLNLPILDGFSATNEIRTHQATRHIPVIAISGHCWDYDWDARARSIGCVGCIQKPVDIDELNNLIYQHARA
jgi:CheY-like chemotaxis protein